jgi:hypothetical protein
MAHPLDGCRHKAKRAAEHVKQFNSYIMGGRIKFHDRAVRVQHQVRFEHGSIKNELLCTVRGVPPDIHHDFAIVAGEAVYQLRSALDHVVWQLVRASPNLNKPKFRPAFPIVSNGRMTKAGWQSAADVYESKTSALKQVISPAAATIIHGLQPFHRSADYEQDPLWLLDELNNIDKHRLLLMTVFGVSFYMMQITGLDAPIDARFILNVPFKHGAEIARIALPDGAIDQSKMQMEDEIAVQIALHKVGTRPDIPVFPCLDDLVKFVGRIIDSFNDEFR